ncbi:MAG: glycosyltransferase family 4 protein [Oscillospiraceae bacterium]|nr:glycosyltransferase family 4 protein [Oscillospiraceae bacterium]
MKRIVQILDSYSYGDGMGNHAGALLNALKARGVDTQIYAKYVDPRLSHMGKNVAEYVPSQEDVILYHLGAGSELNRKVTEYPGRLIINYHNITPPEFFADYNPALEANCRAGYEDVKFLADKVEMAISVSAYNSSELARMGYTCPLHQAPIVMDFSDYTKAPDAATVEKYSDGVSNIVFVGRICPNKKHEDLMLDFYYYTKYFNPNSRLILVGNYRGFEGYYLKLKKYAKKLGLTNVVFTGHIKFSQILAYYHTADLFLCESEHEGFCIPLVEAMHFGVPIVAYDSSAIGETLGTGGVLLREKNPRLTASVMDQILRDESLRKTILEQQKENLKRFDSKAVADRYMEFLLGD